MLIQIFYYRGLGHPLQNIRTQTLAEVQTQAVSDLIARLLPDRANQFYITVEPGRLEEENGYFQVGLRFINLDQKCFKKTPFNRLIKLQKMPLFSSRDQPV